jgi:hypothetical protein
MREGRLGFGEGGEEYGSGGGMWCGAAEESAHLEMMARDGCAGWGASRVSGRYEVVAVFRCGDCVMDVQSTKEKRASEAVPGACLHPPCRLREHSGVTLLPFSPAIAGCGAVYLRVTRILPSFSVQSSPPRQSFI